MPTSTQYTNTSTASTIQLSHSVASAGGRLTTFGSPFSLPMIRSAHFGSVSSTSSPPLVSARAASAVRFTFG